MRLRKILMVASVTFACVAQAQDLTIHVNKTLIPQHFDLTLFISS